MIDTDRRHGPKIKRPTSSAESEIRFVISQGVLSLATESRDLTQPLLFLGT